MIPGREMPEKFEISGVLFQSGVSISTYRLPRRREVY